MLPIVMLVVLAFAIEVPYRVVRHMNVAAKSHLDAFNAVQAGLITLASFVLGLSFAQASARFDARRELVVREANAIGTTWLRADQLGASDAARFRKVLTDYTQERLDAYQARYEPGLVRRTVDQSARDQNEMWETASGALRAKPANLGLSLLMQTLNDTIDVSAEQLQALTTHVPTAVVVLTLVLVTLGAISLGLRFGMDGERPPALSAAYVIAFVVVITMMIDYDRPQSGFVKVNLNPIKIELESMQAAK